MKLSIVMLGILFSCTLAQTTAVTEVIKLMVDEPSEVSMFGCSMAVDGTTLVVGAYLDGEFKTGSVFVFENIDGDWIQQAKLTARDGKEGDQFGISVAISGNTIVVGADQVDDAGFASGAAYVFMQDGKAWQEKIKLTAGDAAVADRFGLSVALENDIIAVGSEDDDTANNSGSAYVFAFVEGEWVEQTKLVASDATKDAHFGISLSIRGGTLAVGAFKDSAAAREAGAVYLFEQHAGSWTEEVKLVADDAQAGALFGHSVSLAENKLLIGAPWDKNNDLRTGAAYIFALNNLWAQEAKLIPSGAVDNARIGEAVILNGTTAILAAKGDNAAGKRSGAAYVFYYRSDAWVEQAKLVAKEPFTSDNLGSSVALSSNRFFVGATGTDDIVKDSGSIYVYDVLE